MGRKVYVVGVGMTKFEKPGSRAWDYPDMAKESGTKARRTPASRTTASSRRWSDTVTANRLAASVRFTDSG